MHWVHLNREQGKGIGNRGQPVTGMLFPSTCSLSAWGSCKSKLAASRNATRMQGCIKAPGDGVYALHTRRPLTRLTLRERTDRAL